jgi:hypothetical protein
VEPGPPVFHSRVNEEGTIERIHTSTAPPVSLISDAELDQLIASTLEIFPQFGRRMIRGHLKSQGYHIPRDRNTPSYLRVHGAPAIFGDRQISRKKYRVPGPLSLAHLDELTVFVTHFGGGPRSEKSSRIHVLIALRGKL